MIRTVIVLTILVGLIAAEKVFAATPINDDAVAVVIGNQNYRNKRIPTVTYAHNDAAAIKRYLIDVLGYRDANIIYLKDATQAEMLTAFGNNITHKGKLWRFIRKGISDVTVFYSGHGVPGLMDKRGYLLPVDADPNAPEINGFSVDVLHKNLSLLGARSVTIYLDACFTGDSNAGLLIESASGIVIRAKLPQVSKGMVVLTAAKANQVASWDKKNKHGIFTHHLLSALYGKADTAPFGNVNGEITVKEVGAYLDREMTYAARREYGREQNASVRGDAATVLGPVPKGVLPNGAPEIATLPPATLSISELDETYIVIKTANVRSEPNVKSLKVATFSLDRGVQVTGKSSDGNWLRINHVGNDAYIWASLVKSIDAAELVAWKMVKESQERSKLEAFLSEHPTGHFALRARHLIAALTPLPKSVVPKSLPLVQPVIGTYLPPGKVFRDCADCPEMVVVPAGSFRMGDLNGTGDSNEKPVHKVTIPRAFAVGKYEVTQLEWRSIMGGRPSIFKGELNPVDTVSWENAKAFVSKLSAKTGNRYRLLSEAEWEYAARAGTTTDYPWGNLYSSSRAANGNSTERVGSFKANAFGLHDMNGNVWEWVEDCWNGSYNEVPKGGKSQTVGDCTQRVLRGGSLDFDHKSLRSSARGRSNTTNRYYYLGFRIARSL
jgi:formylglycine-generating enzyme required for sulfatase activity